MAREKTYETEEVPRHIIARPRLFSRQRRARGRDGLLAALYVRQASLSESVRVNLAGLHGSRRCNVRRAFHSERLQAFGPLASCILAARRNTKHQRGLNCYAKFILHVRHNGRIAPYFLRAGNGFKVDAVERRKISLGLASWLPRACIIGRLSTCSIRFCSRECGGQKDRSDVDLLA